MTRLLILQGPNAGRQFSLKNHRSLIGRQPDAEVFLDSLSVSRQHAQLIEENGSYFIEDAGSSNGTFVNGKRVRERVALSERDTLQVGPYLFGLRPAPPPQAEEPAPPISAQVSAQSSNYTLFAQNPGQKLQVVLQISQDLARTLDLEQLLGKVLDHLLKLFPQASRGMVLLREQDRWIVRAQRGHDLEGEYPYSRTLVNRALEEGVGILSENVGQDQQLLKSQTLVALNVHSLLCVPLICQERRLGVIQLDCLRIGLGFRAADLELLTAVGLQVAVVLENAALHAEHLREERLRQELALARDIQQGFLPTDFAPLGERDFEIFARIQPAREVSGDLYDFFPLPDGQLAFFVGDVSGKGMPAALFMIAVRTLCRHLTPTSVCPAETLARLNQALAADNPNSMFVTLVHGVYDPASGRIVICSGGHPHPLLRRTDGTVTTVSLPNGRLLGYGGSSGWVDTSLLLECGETLVLYSDGFTEAVAPDASVFGTERLGEVFRDMPTNLPLADWAETALLAVEQFAGGAEQRDDLTLLLLRRQFQVTTLPPNSTMISEGTSPPAGRLEP